MKILYLLRHGKAVDGSCDFERGLSPRGESDARSMGRTLKERGINPDIVYCSNAPRARQTAEIILPVTGIETDKICFDDDLYLAPPNVLLELIAGFDDNCESALICGHNPGLELLASSYLKSNAEKFPTCAFREIRFNTESWAALGQDTVEETTLITPKGQ